MRERFVGAAISLVEKGWVPDSLTRMAIRRLSRQRLQDIRQGSDIGEFVKQSRYLPIAPVPDKANEQHYEVPAKFFELVLGPRRKYSSCFFAESDTTLEQAEIASLETTCDRADIFDGAHVLELGCGWGSLTLWMLEHYPELHVTAVSNSNSQREFIVAQAEKAGYAERLHVITADMNEFETEDQFDRVVSLEMFEHMANHHRLLQKIHQWIKPDGKLFVHIFCHREFAYRFEVAGQSDWMSKYFFTGGIMPNKDLFSHYDEHFHVSKDWFWSGNHYRDTCNAWLRNMDRRRTEILKIFETTYGMEQASVWFQRWRMFFMAGAELFGYESGEQWLVGHYLLEPKSVSVDLSAERPQLVGS